MKETNQPNPQTETGKPEGLGEGAHATGPAAVDGVAHPLASNAAAPRASNLAGLKPAKSRRARKSPQAAKPRGRLDREVLAKIGKGLKESFEDVRRQEVPERFKLLLQQF
jgi:Anti-sigma factor NepR